MAGNRREVGGSIAPDTGIVSAGCRFGVTMKGRARRSKGERADKDRGSGDDGDVDHGVAWLMRDAAYRGLRAARGNAPGPPEDENPWLETATRQYEESR